MIVEIVTYEIRFLFTVWSIFCIRFQHCFQKQRLLYLREALRLGLKFFFGLISFSTRRRSSDCWTFSCPNLSFKKPRRIASSVTVREPRAEAKKMKMRKKRIFYDFSKISESLMYQIRGAREFSVLNSAERTSLSFFIQIVP